MRKNDAKKEAFQLVLNDFKQFLMHKFEQLVSLSYIIAAFSVNTFGLFILILSSKRIHSHCNDNEYILKENKHATT